MSRFIDLNADLGEGCGDDVGLMQIITSCNIACGGHAGTPETMRVAVDLAKTHGVAVGAHPAFPDRENFGREPLSMRGDVLQASLEAQISTLDRIAADFGLTLHHVKPHGALYNIAAKDEGLAADVAKSLSQTLPGKYLVGPPNSELEIAARAFSLGFIAEGFADRAYNIDGSLRSRVLPGLSLIHI